MRCTAPYFGAAWYPELWPEAEWDRDLAVMRDIGFNAVRMAEFAWSRLEPHDGDIQLDWLETALDGLAAAGIGAILGTSTAAPPAWLTAKHPELFKVTAWGRRLDAGYRLHVCVNQPIYEKYWSRLLTSMAERFGHDERVIGWQVGNEVHGACFCPVCAAGFRAWLRERYGTVEALNEAWGAGVLSNTYTDWEQIPYPQHGVDDDPFQQTHFYSPSLDVAWHAFTSRSLVRHVRRQAELLHRFAAQPVGTNMMAGYPMVDYHDMHQALDLVMVDDYRTVHNLWESAFTAAFCRPHKPRPFWRVETSTCYANAFGGGARPAGFCTASTWLPIALGGEASLYWLFRQHRAGREAHHGAVLNTAGRPLQVYDEVKAVGRGFRKAAAFLRDAPCRPGKLAMHYSHYTSWIRRETIVCCAPILKPYERLLMDDFWRPLARVHWAMDVIQPAANPSVYKVLLSPYLAALDESGLRPRLREWIENGGTWIAGPCTDDLTIEVTKHTDAVYATLEAWTGVYCRWQQPGHKEKDPTRFQLEKDPVFWKLHAADGGPAFGSWWYDGLDASGAEVLATYAEGPLEGLAAVTRSRLGKGRIVFLGTLPDPAFLCRLVGEEAAAVGLAPVAHASENLVVTSRQGTGVSGWVVVEIEGRDGWLELPRPATDILTGQARSGRVVVPPYGVMALT